MKLVFAQGNPGPQFENTRHNIGFTIVDRLISEKGTEFKPSTKFLADLAEYSLQGDKVIVAKPSTFYNETGHSLNAIKQYYKLDESDVLIVHDELALPFGTLRSRVGGADAGNNGIKSINTHGGAATARLRIGIGSEQRSVMGDTDFVLGKFNKTEQETFNLIIIPKCLEIISEFVAKNHTITSHTLTN